jgi:hypothetical protein
VADEARSHGGTGTVLALSPRSAAQEAEVLAQFDRGEAYQAWRESAAALQQDLPPLGETEARRRLRTLTDAWQALQRIDYYPGVVAAQTELELKGLRRAVELRFSKGEPQALADESIGAVDRSTLRGKRWATRARPRVDRLACAWLIRRFVDADSAFVWLPDSGQALRTPRGAIGFDFDGARFTHVGHRCTLEVMAIAFGLDDDTRLQRIARAVHSLDVGGLPVPEAAGLDGVLAGLRALHADDDALLAAAITVFDALYAAPGATP